MIRRDTSATEADGVLDAQNMTVYWEGEVRRRNGMEYVASYGGQVGASFFQASGYFAMMLTPSGTLESVALS